mmetsp:Transcript_25003/g.48602  ORF Transcript_25003/g.48602 Transcript_25003/m.48602 type:complete len:145 (+) Transcript_25003:66-500(+)|eukprot:CAMPEP_0173391648 /NCGR_PEP_ID=MMETSP1356-20130122/18506_1 /TAXON_ID=77927 ORGANISM="Hemiselmis virescens, Strain PCC157" /NCGR_SAMPLE_ID=MMETSP1356 /ASSEMBLY_ACC=CAM_ASM_000847 /LENGTH=144 /DNA_ID=CAMNT_0014349311 /DNA_START=60 /DNA_END=494 /DNA_ORIENTATION=-
MAEEHKKMEFDQVAINSIWREHIKKERAILTLNDKFRLNPKQLTANMITGKPNVDPARMGHRTEADPEMIAELDDILKTTKKVPTEKYDEPMTTSQQIGWYSVPLMQNRKKLGIKNCEITQYANDYSMAMGRNPFARKEPIVKQ